MSPTLCLQVLDRMLLLWGPLLCWGLLPHTQGEAHNLLLRISKDQLETGEI